MRYIYIETIFDIVYHDAAEERLGRVVPGRCAGGDGIPESPAWLPQVDRGYGALRPEHVGESAGEWVDDSARNVTHDQGRGDR